MTYYCSNCWSEIEKDTKICPVCNFDQMQLSNLSFKDKLILAVNHPEPSTPVRVAEILSKLKIKEAVIPMLARLRTETDPYIIRMFVKSILTIDKSYKNNLINILTEDSLKLVSNIPEFNNE